MLDVANICLTLLTVKITGVSSGQRLINITDSQNRRC
jgi:hypothetical protein